MTATQAAPAPVDEATADVEQIVAANAPVAGPRAVTEIVAELEASVRQLGDHDLVGLTAADVRNDHDIASVTSGPDYDIEYRNRGDAQKVVVTYKQARWVNFKQQAIWFPVTVGIPMGTVAGVEAFINPSNWWMIPLFITALLAELVISFCRPKALRAPTAEFQIKGVAARVMDELGRLDRAVSDEDHRIIFEGLDDTVTELRFAYVRRFQARDRLKATAERLQSGHLFAEAKAAYDVLYRDTARLEDQHRLLTETLETIMAIKGLVSVISNGDVEVLAAVVDLTSAGDVTERMTRELSDRVSALKSALVAL